MCAKRYIFPNFPVVIGRNCSLTPLFLHFVTFLKSKLHILVLCVAIEYDGVYTGKNSRERDMVLAILIGAAAGFIGFVPLFVSLRLSRRSSSIEPLTAGLYGLSGVFVSLIILVVALIICSQVARTFILPFGIAEMLVLIVSTGVYVVYKNKPSTHK